MSKYKKRKKPTPKQELAKEVKKVNWSLLLITFLSVAVIFAVYQLLITLRCGWVMPLYCGLLLILAIAYMVINRGNLGKKLEYGDLPEDWDEEKKQALLAEQQRVRKRSKPILIPIIGILITLAFDIIYLFYLEPLL